jgi:hypothetical protein
MTHPSSFRRYACGTDVFGISAGVGPVLQLESKSCPPTGNSFRDELAKVFRLCATIEQAGSHESNQPLELIVA